MIRALTASKLDLAEACLYPFTSGIQWDNDFQTKWGRFGDAVHSFADLYVRRENGETNLLSVDEADTSPTPIERIATEFELEPSEAPKLAQHAFDIALLLGGETVAWRRSEVRLGYDPIRGTVRELGDGDRMGGEMLLKIDLLFGSGACAPGEADHVVVRDWKTGRRPVLRRIEESRQVGIYAAAVAKWLRVKRVTVELAWCSERGIYLEPALFDAFDFDVIEENVRQLALEQRRGRAVPRYGLHCKEHYCPIVTQCPAAKAAADSVDEAAEKRWGMTTDVEDAEHAADMLARLHLARKRLDAIETAIGEWSRKNGSISVGDGRSWGWVEHEGNERIKLSDGAKVIIGNHLGDYKKIAIEVSEDCSKASIGRAVKKLVNDANDRSKGAQKKRLGPLFDALREAGAIARGSKFEKFEVFVPDAADGSAAAATQENEGEAA